MLTVACVFKPGAGFTDEYVRRLYDGVSAHLTVPHRFVCYTDDQIWHQYSDIPCLPLAPNLCGWFNKASLWLVSKPWPGPILYFDLDTMIVGNLDHLASCPRTALLDDVLVRLTRQAPGQRRHIPASLQTGVMYLTEDAITKLRANHNPATFSRGGDATYVRKILPDALPLQEWAPNQICSWRMQWAKGQRHPDTRVICFHGRPRPADIKWDLDGEWRGPIYTIRAAGVNKHEGPI